MMDKKTNERKSKYAELLRKPEWQKKRLEVLQRDDWACQACGDKTSMLSVHHCYYSKGSMPWDYPDASLVTLCQECHDCEYEVQIEKDALVKAFAMKGALGSHYNEIACAVFETSISHMDVFASALAWVISNAEARNEMIERYFEFLKITNNRRFEKSE